MHPTIQNTLPEGIKMSGILPFLKIIAAQQKLDISKLSHYRKAKRFLLISINQN